MNFPFAHSPRTKPREACFWTTVWCSALKTKVLPFQKNMKFHDVPHLFRYLFWHWFLMSFDLEFESILGASWHQISCFGWSNFERIFDDIFDGKCLQNGPGKLTRIHPFGSLFETFSEDLFLYAFWSPLGSTLNICRKQTFDMRWSQNVIYLSKKMI